ncbi:D-2-hydroxyacid dehydrogenase [Bacillus horti]|uniref:Glycerate dehydrogenase n=1 Tax=Caldalkalibacillus horti TaxID=77523 RepID=A0ABT9W2H1_9BACI|nr:D-2-hydroxyacid dehydrogenase [Bacillus horti]MDQ0167455.1 glycerate dehydrogenase [Bacillus horti]
MKIVVLDGYTLNPGDLSWDELASFGELSVFDRTPVDLIEERAKEAEIVFTNKTPLREDILSKLPNLKYIGVFATGYDNVDVDAAAKLNITVTNIPAYSTDSVAQVTFALLLELTNAVHAHHLEVHKGRWQSSPDFTFSVQPQMELSGKTLGIVGYGTIGAKVAEIGRAFGMKILAYRRTTSTDIPFENFRYVPLAELLAESDVVSLHCPLTQETEKLMNKETLALMKSSSYLINTSRGKLIDEEALAYSLKSGKIAGAGLDVLSVEPPTENHQLIGLSNVVITPHIAWASLEARQRLLKIAVKNVQAFLAGNPVHVVSR